jgi:hypothetical protein
MDDHISEKLRQELVYSDFSDHTYNKLLKNPYSFNSCIQLSISTYTKWVCRYSIPQMYYLQLLEINDKILSKHMRNVLLISLKNIPNKILSELLNVSVLHNDMIMFRAISQNKEVEFLNDIFPIAFDRKYWEIARMILYDKRLWPHVSFEERNEFEDLFFNLNLNRDYTFPCIGSLLHYFSSSLGDDNINHHINSCCEFEYDKTSLSLIDQIANDPFTEQHDPSIIKLIIYVKQLFELRLIHSLSSFWVPCNNVCILGYVMINCYMAHEITLFNFLIDNSTEQDKFCFLNYLAHTDQRYQYKKLYYDPQFKKHYDHCCQQAKTNSEYDVMKMFLCVWTSYALKENDKPKILKRLTLSQKKELHNYIQQKIDTIKDCDLSGFKKIIKYIK